MPSILTLTTDFGLRDHFVASMKGVILGICPAARIVDISHAVEPFQIAEAAFVIAEAFQWFPKNSIHVVVVDPGVGSARMPILVEAAGHYFIGPDNGVFSLICAKHPHRVRHLNNSKYFLKKVSQTFHGRDVFAPAAAHLAKGIKPGLMGPLLKDVQTVDIARPTKTGPFTWTGTVLHTDRFGNLITNFHLNDFPKIQSQPFVLEIAGRQIGRLAACYEECAEDQPSLIAGSSGYLEVVVNRGSAAAILDCGASALVEMNIA